MRLRTRPQTPKPEGGPFPAIRAASLGLILASGAWAYEDPTSSKSGTARPNPGESPAVTRLKEDVSFLADDAREGRAPGTKGIEMAADYIAGVFKAAGLKPSPGADGYFQKFYINSPKLAGKQELKVEGPDGKSIGADRSHFSPLAIGVGATIAKAPIVFAGYGITAHDAARNLDYDDYADIDGAGRRC